MGRWSTVVKPFLRASTPEKLEPLTHEGKRRPGEGRIDSRSSGFRFFLQRLPSHPTSDFAFVLAYNVGSGRDLSPLPYQALVGHRDWYFRYLYASAKVGIGKGPQPGLNSLLRLCFFSMPFNDSNHRS